MLNTNNSSLNSTDAELSDITTKYDESSKIEQHISWITQTISRIVSTSYRISVQRLENQSVLSPASLLLNLSFARNSAIPEYSQISMFAKTPITLTTLSNGSHYALIASILSNGLFSFDTNRSISSQFDLVFKSLASIGFKPRQPCSQFGLMSNITKHHINLCETFEFAIFEKSLSIEKLLEDIRKVPRSFFVLHDGYYPTKIEEAIALWLSKFPCINDLPEIKYSEFEKFQEEVSTGVYVPAVLSRIYPQRINKKSILQTESTSNNSNLNLSLNFDNLNQNINWEKSKQILNELGAFVPSDFSLSYNLFMCFISDLYYATRSGVKKFVRVERSPSAISSSRRPQTASVTSQIIEKNLKPPTEKFVLFNQISIERGKDIEPISNKPIQTRPHTGPNVFRPSRKRLPQNSMTSSNHQKKNMNEVNIHNIQSQKRPIKTAITKKRPSLIISNKNSKQTLNNHVSDIDDETNLMQLFTFMRRGERKDKFVDIDDPLVMIKPLCSLLKSDKANEQTFSKFWSLIQNDPQSMNHYKNCFAFLNALGGNNNEFAASRRIVYFARQMLQSYLPDPASSADITFRSKREINTSYQSRRALLAKKTKISQNISFNSKPDFKALINTSQSDSIIHTKI
ncbi:hypothetical protein M9Y10_043376 [Tritrichomonas musculus]|uniref:Uncharacterized protein n=1 Tax=Tritrichomonas musculus TaxID=1915356 RepID=A0ABR2K0K0_9EUKA